MCLNILIYQLQPFVSIVILCTLVQYLSIVGQQDDFDLTDAVSNNLGNWYAWKFTLITLTWALLSLKVPSRIIYGPVTHFDVKPVYKDNGVLYYWLTLIVFFSIQAIYSRTSMSIFDNMPQILGCFNTSGLLLCLYLLYKGKYRREHKQDSLVSRSIIYDFFTGVELHPRILGVDVKQLFICRVGMMVWQVLICAFYMAGVEKHGFNTATLINLLLQSVYIAKFFWWEGGYCSTLDMMCGRGGYYLCWGALVFVPCLYTYSSFYLVNHPATLSILPSILIGLFGLTFILLNYKVDYERQVFRSSSNYDCTIWAKPATFITAEYKDESGNVRKTALLTSGFWSVARRISYLFELLSALSWCLCGCGLGVSPFYYVIFLTVLLVHRTIVDERRCKNKYGMYWDMYCQQVPYKVIPCVW